MHHFRFIFLSIFCLLTISVFSTEIKSHRTVQDSVQLDSTKNTRDKLFQFEIQRIRDSIKSAELQREIAALKSSDQERRSQIQEEINDLDAQKVALSLQKKDQIEKLRNSTRGYPVIGSFGDTLFQLYLNTGSFMAKERADAISRRINQLTEIIGFSEDSLQVISDDANFYVVHNKEVILSVTPNDALWEDTTPQKLANLYKSKIAAEVVNYKSETKTTKVITNIGLAILVLLFIFFLIKYISKLFHWLDKKIKDQENKRIKGIQLKNYTLFDTQRQINVFLFINKIVKWFVIVLSLYLSLPVLFGIFPRTRSIADTLFKYILAPVKTIWEGFWNYLPNLVSIIVIIIVFKYILKAIHFFKNEIAKKNLRINGFYADWANPTYQIIRVLIIAFMIVVIFPYLPGSDSPVFQGISVFLGFLFTFGSAGSLSNLIAGLVLTYMRLFKIGDRVKIDDVVGDIIEKSSLVTRVRTTKNEIISIPNAKVMNSHTINYSSDAPKKGLIVHTTVTIGYDVPWKEMHEALIEAAERTEFILEEPKPFVLQTSLDDFYVSYEINGYIREPNKQASIYSHLHQNIQDVCNEKGIEIMSPHYRSARDGNTSTIPSSYLPKNYEVPGFNIFTKSKKD
jgi:small-conductance mechanosensitive channel